MRLRDNKGKFIVDGKFKRFKNCLVCNSSYYCRSQLKYDTSKYCSVKCLGDANGKRMDGKMPFKMTDKIRTKITNSRRGLAIWGGKRGTMEWMEKENHHSWKGGVTPINTLQRKKFQREMQQEIFERDNYTCQLCGAKQDLQVDHIQAWAEYIELRFEMSNCRTLCAKCHYKITYGKPMPKTVKTWGHNLLKGGN